MINKSNYIFFTNNVGKSKHMNAYEELLLKPNWNYHDVMFYADCKKSKAYEIMKTARTDYKGSVRFNSQCVSRDSVLQVLNTSIERETYILNQLKGKEE